GRSHQNSQGIVRSDPSAGGSWRKRHWHGVPAFDPAWSALFPTVRSAAEHLEEAEEAAFPEYSSKCTYRGKQGLCDRHSKSKSKCSPVPAALCGTPLLPGPGAFDRRICPERRSALRDARS